MGVYVAALMYSAGILYLMRMRTVTAYRNPVSGLGQATAGQLQALFPASLASLPVILVLGFREHVGTDYDAYVQMFDLYSDGAGILYREPGFWSVNRLADLIAGEPWAMFLIAGLLSVLPLFSTVVRQSPLPWLSIIILFGLGLVYFQTNAVRSAIAIGILFFFYPAIWQKQFWRWCLGVLLSGLFHYTALAAFIVYWLARPQWPVWLLVGTLVAASVVLVYPVGVYVLAAFFEPVLPSQYESYRDALVSSDRRSWSIGLVFYLFKAVVIVSSYTRIASLGVKPLVIQNLSVLGILLFLILYHFDYLGRVAWYFLPVLALYWVYWLLLFQSKLERSIFGIIICLTYLLLFFRGGFSQHYDATPYMSIVF